MMTMVLTQEAPPEYTQPGTDPLAAWLDAHTVTGEELVIEKEALLEAYNAQGPALLPLSDRAFGHALARLRPAVKPGRRRNFGGKALAQVYLGIALGTPEAKPAGEKERDRFIPQGIESNAGYNSKNPTSIRIEEVAPNRYQPRRHFDRQRLEELAASIRAHGVIQPIVVRRPKGTPDGSYELLVGERRLRAAKIAGLEVIPAIVRCDVDDTDAAVIALLENLQRDDLTAIEAARGYQGLQEQGWTQARIAESVGLQQPAIAKALQLLNLPENVQERIEAGPLTPTHALALLRHYDGFPAALSLAAQKAAESDAPARDLERGLPYVSALQDAGLLKVVTSYSTPFDTAICRTACPFDAFRNPYDPSSGYCLRPAHWQELADAAIAAQKEQAAAMTARRREVAPEEVKVKIEQALDRAAAEDGERAESQVVDLMKLQYDAYARLSEADRPPGCTDACPCFVLAMERGRMVKACMQPGRLKRLRDAVGKAARKELKGEFDELLAEVRRPAPTADDQRQQLERRRRGLAQIVWEAINGAGVASRRAAVAGYGDPDLVRMLSEDQYSMATDRVPEAWPVLARQRPEDLVDLAAEILIREEHAYRLKEKSRNTPRTDWYLGRAALAGAGQPALAPESVVTVMPAQAAANPAVQQLAGLAASYARELQEEHGEEEPGTWVACNDRRQPIVGSIILWFETTDGVGPQSGRPPQAARRGRVTEFEGEGAEMRLHVTGDGWSTVIPASVAGLRVMPMVERE